MGEEESGLFRSEMSGVTPLQGEVRVVRRAAPRVAEPAAAERRAAAVREAAQGDSLSDTHLVPLDPWYVLSFKRPGVQNGVFRKLRQGRYETAAVLDLHRMTVARAREEIFDFVAESFALGLRCVSIIHGKAAAQQGGGLLKGGVDRWLRELDVVQAFHSARPEHGGTGAVYVLLRKSEEKKRETRELFARGRLEPQ